MKFGNTYFFWFLFLEMIIIITTIYAIDVKLLWKINFHDTILFLFHFEMVKIFATNVNFTHVFNILNIIHIYNSILDL